MNETMKQNLIIPEVMGEVADSLFGQKLSLLPVTDIDDTLEGVPGDTLKFPCFRYIGKAEAVPENGEVPVAALSADTTEVTVKKYAKAVCITDEARLSGLGDPIGEAARQLAHAIDHALDEELYAVLQNLPWPRKRAVSALSAEAVADALALFGDEPEGEKYLLVDAEGFAALRKDPGYIRQCDLGQQRVFDGSVGEIWGCKLVISTRVKENPVTREKQYFILKPGALRLCSKRATLVEKHREPEYMRDTVFASRRCACYLYDAGKAVSLTKYSGLETVTDGLRLESGETSGTVRLVIDENRQAPAGTRWVYAVGQDAASVTFGTAFSGTPWAGGDAAFTASGIVTAVLVDDNGLPLKVAHPELSA